MAKDIIKYEIEEDGTISFTTSKISQKNHLAADEFLEAMEDLLGSKRKTIPVKNKFWKNHTVARNKQGKIKIQKLKG